MTRWLEVSERYEGLSEIAGSGSNPVILGWLQNEGKGKSWVKDDATPWCGATMAGIFTEAGMAHVLPKEPLRARAWLETGTPLDEPKVGAIVVFPRPPDPASGHVGLVTAFGDGWLDVRGGNQRDDGADKVCVKRFKTTGKSKPVGYRWPIAEKTPKEMAAESRIAAAAARQKRDQAVAGASGASIPATVPAAPAPPVAPPEAIPAPLQPHWKESVENMLGDFTWFKSAAGGVVDFASFIGSKWWFIAAGIAGYFLLRSMWDSHRISKWRAEDHNEGYSQ